MIKNVYSVFDSVSGSFGDPFCAISDAVAQRIIKNSMLGSSGEFFRVNSGDFSLSYIGSFNDSDGSFEPCFPVRCVCQLSILAQESVSSVEE